MFNSQQLLTSYPIKHLSQWSKCRILSYCPWVGLTVSNLRHPTHVKWSCNYAISNPLSILFSDTVISGDVLTENFSVQNAFNWSIPEVWSTTTPNYWLAPNNAQGEFILEFDQPRIVRVIILVNTHNGNGNDRGTKEFKVYVFLNFINKFINSFILT